MTKTISFPAIDFPTDYASILQRIDAVDVNRYGKSRNFLNGAVSYLSPYISRGVISTKQVYEAMQAKGLRLYEMEKWASELAWRDYFQQVWKNIDDRLFTDIKQMQPDVLYRRLPQALMQASTGIEAIDEGIEHLKKTGYMHNHMRMYLAGMVCNVGRYHWLQPAQWMYYHLLDGDLASNYCSWQWVAGAFSSKKYYCNQENINKYTGSTQLNSFLDTNYEMLVDLPVPDSLKAQSAIDYSTTLPAREAIQINPAWPTLLYNSYNLDPLWRSHENANRILLLEPSHFSKFPVSEKVMQFILDLAKNISGIQVYTGEVQDLIKTAGIDDAAIHKQIISKEHPAFIHYPGIKDARDWMATQVQGYYPGFFNYWKKVSKYL